MSVKFLKRWTLYNTGEIATFDAKQEAFLVSHDIAESITLPEQKTPDGTKPTDKGDGPSQRPLPPQHRQTVINPRS